MNNPSDLIGKLRLNREEVRASGISSRVVVGVVAVFAAALLVVALFMVQGRGDDVQPVAAATLQAAATGEARALPHTDPDPAVPATVLDATGYVVARRVATVSAKVTGRVAEMLVEEGQRVEAGQLLARLETTEAEAQLALSRSQKAVARVQVERANVQLREAESNLQRLSSIAADRLIAQSQLDYALAQRDALRADRDAALAAVQVTQDQLAIWQINLENTEVRAPFAGVLISTAAQPGEIVSPLSAGGGFTRTGIGTVVDMDSLEIEVDVAESNIARIRPGMPVQAFLNAYPEWALRAEVVAVIPAVDRARATLRVRIAMHERDPRIVPDMGVRVRFLESVEPG